MRNRSGEEKKKKESYLEAYGELQGNPHKNNQPFSLSLRVGFQLHGWLTLQSIMD